GVWQYYPPNYNRETTFTYLRRVVNKDASGIYIDAPVPFHLDSANNPIHIRRSGPTAPSYQMLDNVGVSGVSIVFADNNSGTNSRPRGAGVVMEGVVNGWVYDVHVYNFPRYGFYFEYDARISFVNCSAKKTQDYGGDGYGYGYHNYGSQNILVNNCYAEDMRHAYIFQKPLANYCVVANSESVDCRQGEDTHHSFSHAILRDNLRHKNGNKMVGYNRGDTSTNAYETYGSGVNWNVTGDGIGGVWESAIFSMNPAPYPAPYTYGIMVGGPDLYRVFDNGSHISGTYVEGDLISPAAGLQVGPNGDRNQLYEGIGQAGLQPISLYEQQLINRLGTVPAVWDNTCGGGPNVPAATPSPNTGPNHLVFNSEHAAWGSNFGSACPLPLNTLTPGTNLDDMGQARSSPEALRVNVTAGSNWTPMVVFGGPQMNTASYTSLEMWIYPTNAAMEFYLNLMDDAAGTALGSSVTVNGSYAQGGAFTINAWNRVTVPVSAFGYSGVFTGIRLARTANAPALFYMDDVYFILNGTPTFTMTATMTPSRTPTINPPVTLTYTSTRTSTATYTRTNTAVMTPTFTQTRTGTPTYTRTNTAVITPTYTLTRTQTATYTRTNTSVITPTFTLTSTGTGTPSHTRTATPTLTITATWTAGFGTYTNTPTITATGTNTASATNSGTFTSTFTYTQTSSATATASFTATNTHTASRTFTVTQTFTGTANPSETVTQTSSPDFTSTFTGTSTGTPVVSTTNTPEGTFTNTPVLTATNTGTVTHSFTYSFTAQATATLSSTPVFSYTATATRTGTNTSQATPTFT
ncbi:MAG TPA: hypothetical protein P5511_04125, partial [Candidatus Goldiibacteriota bacterium]|nr:hypothetical protein [Candidatus Goldiibacteriota bacterium]